MRHNDLVARVGNLEDRVTALESQFTGLQKKLKSDLDGMGRYKNRREEELTAIRVQLTQIVGVLESLVTSAQNRSDADRAAALLRRARNNLTRANRAAS